MLRCPPQDLESLSLRVLGRSAEDAQKRGLPQRRKWLHLRSHSGGFDIDACKAGAEKTCFGSRRKTGWGGGYHSQGEEVASSNVLLRFAGLCTILQDGVVCSAEHVKPEFTKLEQCSRRFMRVYIYIYVCVCVCACACVCYQIV